MPRYKFKWTNLPPSLLRALCCDLDIDPADDPASAMRAAYGARPSPDFVRDGWETLRESWLRTSRESREWVVSELRAARHETGSLNGRDAQMDYLRGLRNAKNLREIVWQELIAVGETDPEEPEVEAAVESEPGPEESQVEPAATTVATVPPEASSRATTTPSGQSTRLADLERRLWDAANALRGPVDPADFKTYVFPMLFWKWISDTWE